jgi:glycerate-2-kinase
VIDRPLEHARGAPLDTSRAPRALLVDLYDAAVAGAAPGPLTAATLRERDLRHGQRVLVFALGKAAHAMATAGVATLRKARCEVAGGVIVAPELLPAPYGTLTSLAGDHPVPGRRSFAAAHSGASQHARAGGGDRVGIIV